MKQRNLKIAYIGGGSRGWAWGLMSDLAMEPELSGTVALYDINDEAARANAVIGNRLSAREDVQGKWTYEVAETMQSALYGADFVILSILPGTFQEMASDVHAPEQYGIYQPVGDTVGPGGIVRALRTIPMYVQFAEAIRAYAPHAWVINYTNPMTLCMRTLYEVFPDIKAIGCCHEVFSTQELLASMLADMKDIHGVSRSEIQVNVLGINHFTWLDRASYKEIDLFPLYKQFVNKYYENGYSIGGKDHWMNSHFSSANRVKFDLFRTYGWIAAAGDRHLAEFMPRSFYLADLETVHHWKFHVTKVDWRIQNQLRLYETSKRLLTGEEQMELHASGEEGVTMMKALLGLGDYMTNVNIPNEGQLAGIPLGAVVETNAVIERDNVRPVIAGQLPHPIQNLVIRHVLNQETTLQAALHKDSNLAFSAFLNDPLVEGIRPQQAAELFQHMLYNTRDYLPGWEMALV